MNIRNWWLKVLRCYPVSVAVCVRDFKKEHGSIYRDEMKKVENLERWFARYDVLVHLRKRNMPRTFSASVNSSDNKGVAVEVTALGSVTNDGHYMSGFFFRDRTLAMYEGFELAFRFMEQRHHRNLRMKEDVKEFHRKRKQEKEAKEKSHNENMEKRFQESMRELGVRWG